MIENIKKSINEIKQRSHRHKELNNKFSNLTLEEKENLLKKIK